MLSLVWRARQSGTVRGESSEGDHAEGHAAHSRRELTLAELQAVCSAATGEMRLLLALGVYAGLRLADAALLEWGSVDMVRRILSVIPVKTARRTQKRITVPIHPALLALLAETPEHRRKGYVMPDRRNAIGSTPHALSKDD